MSKRQIIALSALPAGPGSSDLYWDSAAGQLGIGTTSPTATLNISHGDLSLTEAVNGNADELLIHDDASAGISILTPNNQTGWLVFGDTDDSSRGIIAYDHGTGLGAGADSMIFYAYNALRMVLNSSGNVGIGTTAPVDKLQVEGNIRLTVDSFLNWGGTGTRIVGNANYMRFNTGSLDALSIDSSQRVGIGTTAPGATLSVSGTLSARDATYQHEALGISVSDETTDLATGTANTTFRMPYAMTLTSVRANVNTAPVGSTIIVDINEGGSTILSTKLTIDASEETSTTAATPAVISDTALADDAEITIDIDQVGSSTAGKGLKIWFIGRRA